METASAEPRAKDGRFNARLSDEQKTILQRAADLKGMSLSDFILGTAHEEALRTIAAHEVIRLSRRDRAVFLSLLENPPIPDEQTLERFRKVRKYGAES
ncbi:MAG: DUF1778 domain-containing protein [Candidatus Eremiobacteraeota bacterium]|nr:DUF1778 domain-containing protein [Candidatus Eremiobacteraeota bacterium]